MFLCQVKDYVEDGMEKAMKNYDETKFSDALDTVQKEVLYCIMYYMQCLADERVYMWEEQARIGKEREGGAGHELWTIAFTYKFLYCQFNRQIIFFSLIAVAWMVLLIMPNII